MDIAHMTANKNTIPQEPVSPFYPSGLRLGTPAITTRGMGEGEMRQIARWIAKIIDHIKGNKLPEEKEARAKFVADFKEKAKTDPFLIKLGEEVSALASTFPVPGITNS